MLSIEDDSTFVLVDTTHDEIEFTFEIITDKIVPQVCKLVDMTGIGSSFRFEGGGLKW
jgi:hypothetical protein